MRKGIRTFCIVLGVVLAVGAGLLALSPAVFCIFGNNAGPEAAPKGTAALREHGGEAVGTLLQKGKEETGGDVTIYAEKTGIYSGEEAIRGNPPAAPVRFGDPYLVPVVQEERKKAGAAGNAGGKEESADAQTDGADISEEDRTVTFTFAGDILFDEHYATGIAARQSGILSRFDPGVLELMQGADVFTVNNEFCYSNGGTPLSDKMFTLRAKPDTAAWLSKMGTDLVTLANNHVFDFGETGLLDTLQTLQYAGMPYIGAGKNMEEAASAVYYELGPDGAVLVGKASGGLSREEGDSRMRIAVLSTTQVEQFDNPDTRGATDTLPGVFRCWDPSRLYEEIRAAKENADFVIVCIHWGVESETQKEYRQDVLADGITNAGADLIVGGHPHVLQAIGAVNGKPVAYSLGNFYFTSYTTDTGLLQAQFSTAEKKLTGLRFVPCLQSGTAVQLLTGTERERVLNEMRNLSQGCGVSLDEDGWIHTIY